MDAFSLLAGSKIFEEKFYLAKPPFPDKPGLKNGIS
jgi:hypothetical protein